MDNENQEIVPTPEKRSFLSVFGPGVITGAADDDPSGIATYSQTGAQYGFGLLWTALFMLPMMYVVQEMTARIGIVTGKGIAKNIKHHYPAWLLYGIVLLLVIANIINLGTDLGAMAAATQLLFPIPFAILCIVFAVIAVGLQVFTKYNSYARILKWLCLSLLAYVLSGLLIHQDWLTILKASIIPSISFNFQFLFLIVGILGTTISPYMIFWQASQEVEEELADHLLPKSGGIPHASRRYIGKMRLDTFLGMLFSEITTWFIIVTTAGTLHIHGITNIQTASQAASALVPLVHTFPYAGQIAQALFALGIIGTGLLAVPIFGGSIGYALAETFNFKEGLYRKFKSAHAFYIIIGVATIIGLLINFIGINPIQALIYTAVINGIICVPLIGVLLLVSNRKSIMGSHTNNWWTNLIGFATFIIMAIASIGTIGSLFHIF